MSKKNKKIKKDNSVQPNIDPKETSTKTLIKTYSIIGILILFYFLTTSSYKSIDKKMDKLSTQNTLISNTLELNDSSVTLSSGHNFIGLTEYSKLPLGRLSIKSNTYKNFNSNIPNILLYTIKDTSKNKLIIAGKNENYSSIVFSNIITSNDNTFNSDVTLDVPNNEYFIISAEYTDNYDNLRIIDKDENIININKN